MSKGSKKKKKQPPHVNKYGHGGSYELASKLLKPSISSIQPSNTPPIVTGSSDSSYSSPKAEPVQDAVDNPIASQKLEKAWWSIYNKAIHYFMTNLDTIPTSLTDIINEIGFAPDGKHLATSNTILERIKNKRTSSHLNKVTPKYRDSFLENLASIETALNENNSSLLPGPLYKPKESQQVQNKQQKITSKNINPHIVLYQGDTYYFIDMMQKNLSKREYNMSPSIVMEEYPKARLFANHFQNIPWIGKRLNEISSNTDKNKLLYLCEQFFDPDKEDRGIKGAIFYDNTTGKVLSCEKEWGSLKSSIHYDISFGSFFETIKGSNLWPVISEKFSRKPFRDVTIESSQKQPYTTEWEMFARYVIGDLSMNFESMGKDQLVPIYDTDTGYFCTVIFDKINDDQIVGRIEEDLDFKEGIDKTEVYNKLQDIFGGKVKLSGIYFPDSGRRSGYFAGSLKDHVEKNYDRSFSLSYRTKRDAHMKYSGMNRTLIDIASKVKKIPNITDFF